MSNADFNFDDTKQWATQQWGRACLGDKRRTERAVKLGAAMAEQPSAGLPTQTHSWADLKAAYHLLHAADVTHSALIERHTEQVRETALTSQAAVVLQIQDTTELDYTNRTRTAGLGRIGDDHGRGLWVHSCLSVIPSSETPRILGVAAQKVWTRPDKPFQGNETRAERDHRAKESDVWAEMLQQIGTGAEGGVQFVSVGDRGSDIFGYLRRARAAEWHVLLRVTQNRVITRGDGERDKLLDYARRLPSATRQVIELRGRDGKPKRAVELAVAAAEVWLHAPQMGAERKQAAIRGWVVRCWAEQSARGAAIEWVLFTTVAVSEPTTARQIVSWYSLRWVIEEYHKCLKSGCQIEASQLQRGEALRNLLGFLALVAIRMLQLREQSRRSGDSPAVAAVPPELVAVVSQKLGWKSPVEQIRLREFWHGVARLGGFIGRHRDGDPGWQTLWRGWQRLQDLAWGVQMRM